MSNKQLSIDQICQQRVIRSAKSLQRNINRPYQELSTEQKAMYIGIMESIKISAEHALSYIRQEPKLPENITGYTCYYEKLSKE